MKQAFSWLEDQKDAICRELTELANLNSGSNNLPGLARVADWLEAWMKLTDAEFSRIRLPPRQEMDDVGQLIEVESGEALRWDCRADASKRVLLAIHYDTVFGEHDPFQQCLRVSEERLHGPGVADAKGGILVIGYALQALERFGLAQDCGWTVLLNPDEELGSPHSGEYFRRIAAEFDFGLLFEPALPSGQLVSERRGSGNYHLCVRGTAAHAGRHYDEGRNAVAKLCRLFSELDSLNTTRDDLTVNVARVVGGGQTNIVPDLAVGRLNVRLDNAASVVEFEDYLKNRVQEIDSENGFSCEMLGGISSPPKSVDSAMRSMQLAVERSSEAAGLPRVTWTATGGVCDGNKLAGAGLPNIDTLGPIGGGLHSDAEWVQTTSIPLKAKLIVHLLDQYAANNFRIDTD